MGINIGNFKNNLFYSAKTTTASTNSRANTQETKLLNCQKVNSDATFFKAKALSSDKTIDSATTGTPQPISGNTGTGSKPTSGGSGIDGGNIFINGGGFTSATDGYTKVDGCKYTKDGKTYFYNNKTSKMETKEERIDSSLKLVEEYLDKLHKDLPNNSYVTKLNNLIKDSKSKIASDIRTTDGITIGNFTIAGFGGLGKITLANEAFNESSIVNTASTILHEMIHYSDNDNITSKAEEMDAYAIESGMCKYFGYGSLDPAKMVEKINEGYKIDKQEALGHELNNPTMDELRNYLGYGEDVQAKLAEDKLGNAFTGGFINGGGTVLGAGVQAFGAVGKAIGGETGEKIGRVVGGVIAFVPAVVTGVVTGVVSTVVTAAKKVGKWLKGLFGK